MAATLVHDCPHCNTEKSGFTLVGEAPIPNTQSRWHVFFRCNSCFGPLAVAAYNGTGQPPSKLSGNLARLRSVDELKYFPKATVTAAPAHAPEPVARAFIQADYAIKRQHWEAAAAMDRRALEISTKEMAPEHIKLSLYQRIEKLADAGKLTPSLKEWAHDLRLLGNDALHEIDGVTEEEATQAHELTRFVLIYLYTLPAQVEQARAERENGD